MIHRGVRPAVFTISCVSTVALAVSLNARADGDLIDKVYHPYVQPLERELELRASLEEGGQTLVEDRQTWRLGYGMAVGEQWFAELYAIGERDRTNSFRVGGYEAELLWQLTEQGEYTADWGLLFEVATADDPERSEVSTTLLAETGWRKWSATANLSLAYESGNDIDDEFETALALQARYRQSMGFEPALEIFSGEDTLGAGPVLTGNQRMGPGQRIHWEAGLILGLKDATPDRTFRLLLEYEF